MDFTNFPSAVLGTPHPNHRLFPFPAISLFTPTPLCTIHARPSLQRHPAAAGNCRADSTSCAGGAPPCICERDDTRFLHFTKSKNPNERPENCRAGTFLRRCSSLVSARSRSMAAAMRSAQSVMLPTYPTSSAHALISENSRACWGGITPAFTSLPGQMHDLAQLVLIRSRLKPPLPFP
jgi:hypothetical protein